MLNVPRKLAILRNIDGYSGDAKATFHREGKTFLRSLAKELGLKVGTFDVRSNEGGPAVSGEVTLHSETLYVQLSESCVVPGVGILYRSCKGLKDYTGGQNHWAKLGDLMDEGFSRTFLIRLRVLGGLS